MLGEQRNAYAGRHVEGILVHCNGQVPHPPHDVLGDDTRLMLISVGQDDGEFVASHASCEIGLPEPSL